MIKTIFGSVFEPIIGCSRSYVGCKFRGDQSIWISHNKASKGNVWHEMCHCLGLLHEHQRIDRYIHISVNDIGNDNNYRLKEGRIFGKYDKDSIMHYRENAKIKDLSIQPSRIGQRKKLSNGDLKTLKYL